MLQSEIRVLYPLSLGSARAIYRHTSRKLSKVSRETVSAQLTFARFLLTLIAQLVLIGGGSELVVQPNCSYLAAIPSF